MDYSGLHEPVHENIYLPPLLYVAGTRRCPRQYVRCNGQTRTLSTGVICSCSKVHNTSFLDTERQVPTRSGSCRAPLHITLVCIYDLPCHISGQRPKIDFDRKWISEINLTDTDQQQLYTNLWLNRTLYTPKHHRTTTIISIIPAKKNC